MLFRSSPDRKRFLEIAKRFHFDDPYLFKYCADQVIRRCIPFEDISHILSSCHLEACGGHFSSQKTAQKVLYSGFYWPTIFKDSYTFCKSCACCQMLGSLSRKNEMPMTPIITLKSLIVGALTSWGHSPPLSTMNIFCWRSSTYQSGSKQSPLERMIITLSFLFLKRTFFLGLGPRRQLSVTKGRISAIIHSSHL